MRLYWKEIASNQQAYNELDYYDQLYAAEMLDEDELRRIEINASYWRPQTVDQYNAETLYFQRLQFDNQSGKHRPRDDESIKRIVERSVKNALFFLTSTPSSLPGESCGASSVSGARSFASALRICTFG
jgi:hypothetical protein